MHVGGSSMRSSVSSAADDEAKQTETGPVEQNKKRKKRVIPNDGKVKQKLSVDVAIVNTKCPFVRAAWAVPPSVGQTLTQKLNLQAGPWQFWDAWLSKLRLELYAGSGRLTEAARAAGLVCGPAVDWLYDPSSHSTSTSASPTQLCLDLGTQKDRDIVRQLIQENTPSWLHSGEPCTFWVTLSRSTARKFPQEWVRAREIAVQHCHFGIDLAEYQRDNGRIASRESPLCAGSWQTDVWKNMFTNGFEKNRYDSCQFGLVDEHARPLKKPGIVAANRKMSHIARWAAVRVPDAGLSHTGDATASLLKQVLVSCLPFCLELAVGCCKRSKARQVLLFLKEDALLPRLPSTSKNSGPPSTSASEARASSSSAAAGKRDEPTLEPSPLTLWRNLVTIGADGAMVGESGTSVDQHLAGKTGLSSRLGFHDFLHLFDAVGRGVMKHRPHNDKSSAAADKVEAEASASESDSNVGSDASDDDGGPAATSSNSNRPLRLDLWLRMLKKMRQIFKRGASRSILDKARICTWIETEIRF
ncbi:unnamed protein product [Symbiodinium sp. CCMP2592]|nr:unnamed protein product [Symbiodinium sp. CCMP2592]